MAVSMRKYPKKAVGIETRGKTANNRLRRVDNFVLMYCVDLIKSEIDFYVDVGYGYRPITTLESADRFRRINSKLNVIGVEIDGKRVRDAQMYVDERTDFRQGGFNLPLKFDQRTGRRETVNLIRAFNVLRQYEYESDCRKSHIILGQYLNPGGILIEGTSDPPGRIWVANLIRKRHDQTLIIEALVFSTNFQRGFDINEFQEVLPKNFIHRMIGDDQMIFNFFQHWKMSYDQVGKSIKTTLGLGVRQQFIATANHLADFYGYEILNRKKFLRLGYLIWLLKPGGQGVDNEQITY